MLINKLKDVYNREDFQYLMFHSNFWELLALTKDNEKLDLDKIKNTKDVNVTELVYEIIFSIADSLGKKYTYTTVSPNGVTNIKETVYFIYDCKVWIFDKIYLSDILDDKVLFDTDIATLGREHIREKNEVRLKETISFSDFMEYLDIND